MIADECATGVPGLGWDTNDQGESAADVRNKMLPDQKLSHHSSVKYRSVKLYNPQTLGTLNVLRQVRHV